MNLAPGSASPSSELFWCNVASGAFASPARVNASQWLAGDASLTSVAASSTQPQRTRSQRLSCSQSMAKCRSCGHVRGAFAGAGMKTPNLMVGMCCAACTAETAGKVAMKSYGMGSSPLVSACNTALTSVCAANADDHSSAVHRLALSAAQVSAPATHSFPKLPVRRSGWPSSARRVVPSSAGDGCRHVNAVNSHMTSAG